jgi:murein DD-endopeptidase MepM/ murein hydrolase activator NlpD
VTTLLEPAAGRASAELEATGRIPGLRPVTAIPRPRPAVTGTGSAVAAPMAPATGTAPAATGSPAPDGAPQETGTGTAAATPRRSVRRPPGRRGALWLAALVAGALVAAVPGFTASGSTPVPTSAADYGLGAEFGFAGDMEDAGVRRGITEAEAAVRLSELAASRAAREPQTALPTSGRLTTCFCMRWGSMHYGIDLAAPLGTPIHSATDGVVLRAGRASGYGNAVYIQDADGNVHVYGHMRYYDVTEGQIVHAGDQIAQVGNEGQSTGPHLHYQIHGGGPSGRPIDPQEFLAERGVTV